MKNTEVHEEYVFLEKMLDALTPGVQIEFDPGEASKAGAFFEDALSEEEALESSLDLSASLQTSRAEE